MAAPSPATSLVGQLEAALRADDLARSEALIRLWLTGGAGFPALCDRVLRPALDRALDGADPVGARRVSMLSLALISRLRRPTAQPTRGVVAFAVPAVSPPFVEAYMLATALEREGWQLLLLGSMDVADLDGLAAPEALVVGSEGAVRPYLRQVRQAMPTTVLVSLADVAESDLVVTSVEGALLGISRLALGATDLDLQILAQVARGRTNKEIARELELASSTVKSRLDRLFVKLGVPDRAAAAAVAVRHGWID